MYINNTTGTSTTLNVCQGNLASNPQDILWATIFIWIANGIGFIYNLPQVYHTYKTKKTADISGLFLLMRLVASAMWVFYCIYFFMPDVLASWLITGSSNMVIIYYKYFYKPPIAISSDANSKDTGSNNLSEISIVNEEPNQEQYSTNDYDIIILKTV
jgi:uncharacterized protein with PQ loop repeat